MKNLTGLLLAGVMGMAIVAGCQKADEGTGEPTPAPAAGTDKMGADKMGADKMGADKMGADKMGADKMGADKMGGH